MKLADLGIATAADSTRITRTGGMLGTAAYMAPEQAEPGPATAAADVYALAAVAFEVLTGRRAYPGASAFEVMERLRAGAGPPDPREADPDLPEAAARAVQSGMATDPADRPSSAGAFVADLITALAAEQPGGEPRRRRPTGAGAGRVDGRRSGPRRQRRSGRRWRSRAARFGRRADGGGGAAAEAARPGSRSSRSSSSSAW